MPEDKGARSQPATPSPVATFPPEVNTCLDALQAWGSVRADDHEVGQPSPEDVERARSMWRKWFHPDGTSARMIEDIAAALSAARADGEHAGIERAARHAGEYNNRFARSVAAGIRLLPPSTPETKP